MDLYGAVGTVADMRTLARRNRRGIALLATVTLAAVAAVAAIVIITLTLDATRSESNIVERVRAKEEALDAKIQIEEALAESPLFFYSEVHALERARVCTEGDSRVVEPGNAWPRECGSSWGYQKASIQGDTRIEIQPGNLDTANMTVTILASAGRSEYGLELEYRLDSLARYSLYSSAGMDLEKLPSGTNELSGEIYSGGVMKLPTGTVNINSGMFVAEGGFSAHPDTSTAAGEETRFYAGEADTSGTIKVQDTLNLYNPPVDTMAGAQATFAGALDIACPGTDLGVVAGRARYLCLKAGEGFNAVGGTVVEVPEDTLAYLLIFSASGAETVDVYASAKTSGAPNTCSGACNLAASSAASVAAGNHPGDLAYWTKLGAAVMPTNGLIATDRDTHIGLCGGGFKDVAGTCTDWDGSGGMRIERNITILTGSLTNPSDIYVSGPVAVATGSSFGAVAAGNLYIPYWARVQGENLNIAGAYSGLGLGSDGASVGTYPSVVGAGPSRGGVLNLDGGLAGRSIEEGFEMFAAVNITGRGAHWRNPPILYPAMNGAWKVAKMRYLPSAEICGSVTCPGY